MLRMDWDQASENVKYDIFHKNRLGIGINVECVEVGSPKR